MRILFVHETLGFQGGVEQTVADAAAGLRARGHQVGLAHGPRRGSQPQEFLKPFEVVGPWEELLSLIQGMQPEVLYLHKVPHLDVIQPGSRLRTVRMIHDHDVTCPRRHRYSSWTHQICPHAAGWRCWLDGAFLARREGQLKWVDLQRHQQDLRRHRELDAILVGSRYMRTQMLTNGLPEERVHVLPPLVNWTPAPPAALPAEPHMLFVGQLIRGKGVDLLLHAMARLDSGVTLSVVGEGNMRAELEALAATLNLTARVTFHGFMPHPQVVEQYRRARLVAVPSRWPEPFGMVGPEALSQGRPVVAFGVGGIPDWLCHGKNGMMVAPGDISGYARALDLVLREPGLAESLAGQAQASLDPFKPQQHFEQLETFLGGKAA